MKYLVNSLVARGNWAATPPPPGWKYFILGIHDDVFFYLSPSRSPPPKISRLSPNNQSAVWISTHLAIWLGYWHFHSTLIGFSNGEKMWKTFSFPAGFLLRKNSFTSPLKFSRLLWKRALHENFFNSFCTFSTRLLEKLENFLSLTNHFLMLFMKFLRLFATCSAIRFEEFFRTDSSNLAFAIPNKLREIERLKDFLYILNWSLKID